MKVLDESSLATTLWNLEEARICGSSASEPSASEPSAAEALIWVASRHGLPGSYRGILAAPTGTDIQERRGTPTGEDGSLGHGGAMHVLGEEAARALSLWGVGEGWDRERVLRVIAGHFREAGNVYTGDRPGRFCCRRCSVSRWRAVAAGKPRGWEDVLFDGVRMLDEHPLDKSGRWRGFPFYYTLLALSEIPLVEVERERFRVQPAAERALRAVHADDQPGRFRLRALEWALGI